MFDEFLDPASDEEVAVLVIVTNIPCGQVIETVNVDDERGLSTTD